MEHRLYCRCVYCWFVAASDSIVMRGEDASHSVAGVILLLHLLPVCRCKGERSDAEDASHRLNSHFCFINQLPVEVDLAEMIVKMCEKMQQEKFCSHGFIKHLLRIGSFQFFFC